LHDASNATSQNRDSSQPWQPGAVRVTQVPRERRARPELAAAQTTGRWPEVAEMRHKSRLVLTSSPQLSGV
jgi:hypothetical protein